MEMKAIPMIQMKILLFSLLFFAYYTSVPAQSLDSTLNSWELALKTSVPKEGQSRLDIWVEQFSTYARGKPYGEKLLEEVPERLVIHLDQFDCVTLVETMLAFYQTINIKLKNRTTFSVNLQSIRYRNASISYPTRNHYFEDWLLENQKNKNIQLLTEILPDSLRLDFNFMSQHPQYYPQLSDSMMLNEIKNREKYLSERWIRYSGNTPTKNQLSKLKTGDIIAFIGSVKGLGTVHTGIISLKNGKPYVFHASQSKKKVEISQLPLDEFFQFNRKWIGWIIARPI